MAHFTCAFGRPTNPYSGPAISMLYSNHVFRCINDCQYLRAIEIIIWRMVCVADRSVRNGICAMLEYVDFICKIVLCVRFPAIEITLLRKCVCHALKFGSFVRLNGNFWCDFLVWKLRSNGADGECDTCDLLQSLRISYFPIASISGFSPSHSIPRSLSRMLPPSPELARNKSITCTSGALKFRIPCSASPAACARQSNAFRALNHCVRQMK